MFFIKYILIFFIVIISARIGQIYSKKYINRVKELESIKQILNELKTKIKFTYKPLQDIFYEIASNHHDNIGKIFESISNNMKDIDLKEAWEKEIKESDNSLSKEDIEILLSIGKVLGTTDVEGQINQIILAEELIENKIKEAEIEKAKNVKLYRVLGTSAGLTLAIILI